MSATGVAREARALPLVRLKPSLAGAMGGITLVGLTLAGYMAWADLCGATLVCGGIGDCNLVHASPYARLWGLPVSLLGLGSYVALGLLQVARWRLRGPAGYLSLLGVLALAVGGALFSGYLTYVELYLLRALCPWCVLSALAITGLLFLAMVAVVLEVRRVPAAYPDPAADALARAAPPGR